MAPSIRNLAGLIARFAAAKKPPQAGADDQSAYFGPGIAVAPIAPAGSEARGWQYWPNINMNFLPRPDAVLTAQALREVAIYPLAAIAIENCKDVITSLPRQIRAKKKPGEKNADVDKRSKNDPVLKMLNDFFDCPDGQHQWDSWARPILHDMYVLDAPAIIVRRANKKSGSKISELRWTDGAFITCLVDEFGYEPKPPYPAYQQLWSGTPATVGGIPYVNLTTDDLVYRPRNIVPRNTVASFLYGYSPTEQQYQELQIGQNRLNWVLSWYISGQTPDVLHIVPPNVSPDELEKANKAIKAELSGQTWKRSGGIQLVQGFVDRSQPGAASGDQIINLKEKLFADPFDEMHIRKVFYGYGASSQRILKAMNRASAQASQEASEEEGTMPFAISLKNIVDWIIAKHFGLGFNSYELTYDQPRELDPVKRAAAAKSDVDAGIITRDEEREARGMDSFGGDAAKLLITTNTGTVPVDLDDQVEQARKMNAVKTPPAGPDEEGDTPPKNPKKKVAKRAHIEIDPARETVHKRQARARMEHALNKLFHKQREKAAVVAARIFKAQKAADDPTRKADEIFAAIEVDYENLIPEARQALEDAGLAGGSDAIVQLESDDGSLISAVNTIAQDYARTRAAQMVGMKYNEAGELVENPNAKWAISRTTRDRLREIVKGAYEEKSPFSELIADIREADAFSEERATMIARTETQNAQVRSNFDVWAKSGMVTEVQWLAVGPDPCEICLGNNGVTVELGDEFPSGDRYPTAHPRCFCILRAVGFTE